MKQQNQNHGISRRSFLGGMVATTASGVIGSSLLAPAAQAAVSAGKSRLLVNGSHWGAFRARVENGKLVEVLPFEKDIMPVKMIDGVMGQLYSPARVRYPMVRLDWLKKGHKSDTSQRGDNRFVRVSWDKAIDLVYGELERVQKTHGPSGLYAGHTGWKHNGQINNCISALQRGVSLHGNFVKKVGDYSTGAGQVILPHVVGSTEVYSQQTSWPLVLKHSKTIVLWGTDPMKNLLTGWKTPDHGVYPYWKELKEKVDAGEIKVISVDPTVSDTQAYLGCDQVALNPQTDVPLMLAIAHTLYTEELHDAEFLEEYTVGFDKFLPYLLGKSDNQPKTAEWAAKICGIKAEDIRELARTIAAGRTQLMGGWCVQRMHHGEQWAWMLVVIASMLGQVGLPGGGFGFGWHYNGAGVPTRKGIKVPGFSGKSPSGTPKHEGDFGKYSTVIPVARYVDSILEPGKVIDHNGKKVTLPPIKMAMFSGNNTFHHHQNRNRQIQAWQKLETVISVDSHWTATCRFADIVLPATTAWERNDIDQYGNHSNRALYAMYKLVEPLFEARNDFDIFKDLVAKFGDVNDFTEGRDEMDWIEWSYNEGRKSAKGKGINMPTFKEFWEGEGYFEFDKESEKLWVRHSEWREEPELEALGTPSGLIEIFSEKIAKMGYDDCKGHPTWMEPYERSHGGKGSGKYALHLQSCHPRDRIHSQLCASEPLRDTYAVAGREPIYLSKADAKNRGIKSGDLVRVFNDRGQVLAGAVVTDRHMDGVVRIFEGAWYSPEKGGEVGTICTYGDPNVLTQDIGASKLSQATTAHTALVEVEKYKGKAVKATGFNGPEIVS